MKNRRNALVAFLLVATLVMGIGFATVTGQLNIMGTAKYNSYGETSSDVHTAVKFTDATAVKNCTAAITDKTAGDTANMIIVFNDVDADANRFEASAVYTITYESTDTTLPVVTFSDPVENNDNNRFVVSYAWEDDTKTLAPGDSIKLTVTVVFEATATDTDVQNAIITIPLPYASATRSTLV